MKRFFTTCHSWRQMLFSLKFTSPLWIQLGPLLLGVSAPSSLPARPVPGLQGHRRLRPTRGALPWRLGAALPAGKPAVTGAGAAPGFVWTRAESWKGAERLLGSSSGRSRLGRCPSLRPPAGWTLGRGTSQARSSRFGHRPRQTRAGWRFCPVSIGCCNFQVNRTRSRCARLRNGSCWTTPSRRDLTLAKGNGSRPAAKREPAGARPGSQQPPSALDRSAAAQQLFAFHAAYFVVVIPRQLCAGSYPPGKAGKKENRSSGWEKRPSWRGGRAGPAAGSDQRRPTASAHRAAQSRVPWAAPRAPREQRDKVPRWITAWGFTGDAALAVPERRVTTLRRRPGPTRAGQRRLRASLSPSERPNLLEIAPEPPAQGRVLAQCISKLLPAQAGVELGFLGGGNTQPTPAAQPRVRSWVRASSARWQPCPARAATHLLAKKATQGKRRSCVSTKTFCTKRFGLQLCCKGSRDAVSGRDARQPVANSGLQAQAAVPGCRPQPARACWNGPRSRPARAPGLSHQSRKVTGAGRTEPSAHQRHAALRGWGVLLVLLFSHFLFYRIYRVSGRSPQSRPFPLPAAKGRSPSAPCRGRWLTLR